jgi:transposase
MSVSADGFMPRRGVRRSWTRAEKQQIVAQTYEPGAKVAEVARRHGMNANHLFLWRQRASAGQLGCGFSRQAPEKPLDFLPLGIVGEPNESVQPIAAPLRDEAEAGRMDILLPNGVTVRVDASVNGGSLRRVLLAMKGAL